MIYLTILDSLFGSGNVLASRNLIRCSASLSQICLCYNVILIACQKQKQKQNFISSSLALHVLLHLLNLILRSKHFMECFLDFDNGIFYKKAHNLRMIYFIFIYLPFFYFFISLLPSFDQEIYALLFSLSLASGNFSLNYSCQQKHLIWNNSIFLRQDEHSSSLHWAGVVLEKFFSLYVNL